ncbi:calcineurin-binding protein cabin-1-like [Pararge aegeria]|uniref:calcineurin-binding protein cabin-1-like n=1 Tax=Pararge aegeria TaxID=116150 RepID=UPI0019D2F7B5|nr:calcineurin-binding protein cabin-1-like [Pararge aegeria]
MIKISALNDESEEDSDSEVEVSREALEQIALQQYAKALELQRKGNLTEATQLLRDLLDTELLYDVKRPCPGEKVSGPLFNLKYLCYKNLASILTTAGDTEGAIEAYNLAAELDDTDITLWHRLGTVCLQVHNYETALYAFQKGVERNPRHWPCLDKLIIVLLGLNYKEQCLATIHDALQLDPGYMRGLVYRNHIYKVYSHMKEYMECINPTYKCSIGDDEALDEETAEKLLKEAEIIHEAYIEQQKAETNKYIVPNLKLKKLISRMSWQSVGESLVHMHNYITENCYSHACFIELLCENGGEEEKMEVCEEHHESDDNIVEEINTDTEKVTETGSENENNDLSDKDKATDSDKVETVKIMTSEPTTDNVPENKAQKKVPARRRGNPLNNLKQWGWYERKSLRKKPVDDDNIYEMLRRMVPIDLVPEIAQKKEMRERGNSPEISNLDKLFEEKPIEKYGENTVYFGTDSEQNDVKSFIDKYIESSRDIIDLLKDYLSLLAGKWKTKWPAALAKVFVDANNCYNNHIDIPACTDDNKQDLLHYTSVNMLAEEFRVNEKIKLSLEEKANHELNVIESIEIILTLKPHIYPSTECLEMILRSLWLRLHIHILNKCEELALDCSYNILSEFDAMGEHHDVYSLKIANFTFKTDINENEVLEYIKILERNKKLSTVMDLFRRGSYEEVLSIVTESFEHCKTVARKKEEDMPLDFCVQLSLILDSYWALDKVECCFKWSLICLHEALKHYFRLTSGSVDYVKWNLTVIKILTCIEHILSTEGLSCLETVTQNELGQGLEDLIRIIGHQVESNATDMPFNTVAPWIIIHYILQREEDQGRSRSLMDSDRIACDEVPNPLMVLFIAHEQLGERAWCCKSDGKLLYFILDTVVPRLQSPSLSKALEQIKQYMEQCVFCLYGHPGKKNKLKYLVDHNVTPQTLDWKRAQQIYEIFRPIDLPPLEGKVSGISLDAEALFLNILSLLPAECDPSKYVPEMKKYINGTETKLPLVPAMLPYKMKDIYFLLGDFYFKKNDMKMAIKYNTLDVVINNDRFKSWAQISLAKATNLQRALDLYRNINNEKDFLNPAKTTIRCFKRSLELDPSYRYMWIEFGNFVYCVHSFCSRLLKQATESIGFQEFRAYEKQKEDLLNLTYKCFVTLRDELNSSSDTDKSNEESWLLYYMLGKVAEKRNKPPALYLNFYLQGIKNLQEAGATYPTKINYNSPSHLSIEVLELHYRIHASILKYIEQHENKLIPASVGKVFLKCIEEWEQGPYKKKLKKDNVPIAENETKADDSPAVHAANILKRSISDAGEEDNREAKRLKLESAAAKIRRSASYDTERMNNKESQKQPDIQDTKEIDTAATKDKQEASKESRSSAEKSVEELTDKKEDNSQQIILEGEEDKKQDSSSSSSSTSSSDSNSSESSSGNSSESSKDTDASSKSSEDKSLTDEEIKKIVSACLDALEDCASRYTPHYKALYRLAHYHFYYKKGKDIERCRDLMLSTFISRSGKKMTGLFSERKSTNFFNNIWLLRSEEVERSGGFAFHMNRCVLLTLEILKEIDDHGTLLDLTLHLQRAPDLDKKYLKDSDREELALQACSLCVQSLKGQLQKFSQQVDIKSNDVEREALKCLMLDIYNAYKKVMKPPNSKQLCNLLVDAYKLVCRTPITENMNLVDCSLKYASNLKQQAAQASVQKKQTTKATVAEPAKLIVTTSQPKMDPKPVGAPSVSGLPKMSSHEMATAFQNYVPMLNDPVFSQLSLSYISALTGYPIQGGLQPSFQTSLQNSFQAEFYRQFMGQNFSSYMQPQKKQKRGPKQPSTSRNVTQIKNVTSKSFTASPTSVTKAAQSSAMKALPTPLTKAMSTPAIIAVPTSAIKTVSTSVTKSVLASASKAVSTSVAKTVPMSNTKTAPSSITKVASTSITKAAPTSVITSLQKPSSTPLAPSMGTVLSTLPASIISNLPSFGGNLSHTSNQTKAPHAHMSSASSTNPSVHCKPPMPHQQVSPGKTLQEKLAERQKSMPSAPKDINASISRLPSSLTITKTSASRQPLVHGKRSEPRKSLAFEEVRLPISSDEVIVLDDD